MRLANRLFASRWTHSAGGRSVTATLLIGASIVILTGAQQPHRVTHHATKQVACRVDDATPVDNEVCFSPDNCCDIKLVRFIQSATTSIDVAVYDINLQNVVKALVDAVASGSIAVRVIVDRKQSKGKYSLVHALLDGHVPVVFGKQPGIMHNKFVVIDQRMVEVGSFNFTNNATRNNNENQVYLESSLVVLRYEKRFNELWDAAQKRQRASRR